MVKDFEIRRGSIVEHAHEGKLIVTGTGAVGFAAKDAMGNQWKFNYEDVDGVPLTPDIMSKLDIFFYRPSGPAEDWFTEINEFGAILIIHKKETKICGSNQMPIIVKKCEFLHQLQNLFSALIGEELPVNLKDL